RSNDGRRRPAGAVERRGEPHPWLLDPGWLDLRDTLAGRQQRGLAHQLRRLRRRHLPDCPRALRGHRPIGGLAGLRDRRRPRRPRVRADLGGLRRSDALAKAARSLTFPREEAKSIIIAPGSWLGVIGPHPKRKNGAAPFVSSVPETRATPGWGNGNGKSERRARQSHRRAF